jgi:hypothetical protein
MLNKKAQIGETITWVVATLIIIVVLVFSIFIAGIYFKEGKNLKSSFFKSKDVLASKSMFSYLLTPSAEGKVYDQLKTQDNLNEFNGNLSLNIFKELYEIDYPAEIWFGLVVLEEEREELDFLYSLTNEYFGTRPGGERGTEISYHLVPYVSEKIKLDENKSVEVVLIEG